MLTPEPSSASQICHTASRLGVEEWFSNLDPQLLYTLTASGSASPLLSKDNPNPRK